MSAIQIAKFSFSWKIDWSEFSLCRTNPIEKTFVTSCDYLPLFWRLELGSEDTAPNQVYFYNFYADGPLPKVRVSEFIVSAMKPDKTVALCKNIKFDLTRGFGRGWLNFDEGTPDSIKRKYGYDANSSDPLLFQITLKIPISVFSEYTTNPLLTTPDDRSPSYGRAMFQDIEDPEKATYSNAKLISRDGKVFYCDKVILAKQSDVFQAMFRHPPAKDAKEGEYEFPAMGSDALKSFLEFVYTGKATFANPSISTVYEAADAAEQYNFKRLVLACGSILWDHAVKKPEDRHEILNFAELHDDLKHLRDHVMDVLLDKWESLDVNVRYLIVASDFETKLVSFSRRRLEPVFTQFEQYFR